MAPAPASQSRTQLSRDQAHIFLAAVVQTRTSYYQLGLRYHTLHPALQGNPLVSLALRDLSSMEFLGALGDGNATTFEHSLADLDGAAATVRRSLRLGDMGVLEQGLRVWAQHLERAERYLGNLRTAVDDHAAIEHFLVLRGRLPAYGVRGNEGRIREWALKLERAAQRDGGVEERREVGIDRGDGAGYDADDEATSTRTSEVESASVRSQSRASNETSSPTASSGTASLAADSSTSGFSLSSSLENGTGATYYTTRGPASPSSSVTDSHIDPPAPASRTSTLTASAPAFYPKATRAADQGLPFAAST